MNKIIKFSKMCALGNDFAIFNYRNIGCWPDSKSVAKIAHRKFGVGCDQVIFYDLIDNTRSDNTCEIVVKFYNSDGSNAEICGNGLRAVGILLREEYGLREIYTNICGKIIKIFVEESNVVNVDMGKADFSMSNEITSQIIGSAWEFTKIYKDFIFYKCFFLKMPNPHLIFFLNSEISRDTILLLGKFFENHESFSDRTNVGFANVMSETEILLNVWERGAGLTNCCGSGACAAAACAIENKFVLQSSSIRVNQVGGSLLIKKLENGNILQTGTADLVLVGQISIIG